MTVAVEIPRPRAVLPGAGMHSEPAPSKTETDARNIATGAFYRRCLYVIAGLLLALAFVPRVWIHLTPSATDESESLYVGHTLGLDDATLLRCAIGTALCLCLTLNRNPRVLGYSMILAGLASVLGLAFYQSEDLFVTCFFLCVAGILASIPLFGLLSSEENRVARSPKAPIVFTIVVCLTLPVIVVVGLMYNAFGSTWIYLVALWFHVGILFLYLVNYWSPFRSTKKRLGIEGPKSRVYAVLLLLTWVAMCQTSTAAGHEELVIDAWPAHIREVPRDVESLQGHLSFLRRAVPTNLMLAVALLGVSLVWATRDQARRHRN